MRPFLPSEPRFCRANLPAGHFYLQGLAAPYGCWGSHEDAPAHRLAPDAFYPVVSVGDASLTFEYGNVLASQRDGSLRLTSTSAGLMFEATLEANQLSWTIVNGIHAGKIQHLCATWRAHPAAISVDANERRTIASVSLLREISILAFSEPAFSETWIELGDPFFRALDPAIGVLRLNVNTPHGRSLRPSGGARAQNAARTSGAVHLALA